ncbi:hypothetical protein HPC38_01405 [Pasteurellaceae bacterium HPA106]|uniref:hypothetical protein n=1 Tax=Spirabiliibacterium pneumoniae TaxID=221400 RepID=UPI001AAD790B|nr:hypothetical protein [Spirabiliibacterium pneumoniae]MBE2895534.1 hypothetical protein [Spirabiliibacterium pneumoniae]
MIKITDFGGIVPKIASRNLSPDMAAIAENVNLDHGTLKPFRTAKKISDEGGQKLFVHNCCVTTADCDASFAETGVACDHIIVSTGITDYPSYSQPTCPFEWKKLSFECDLPKPTALFSGELAQDLRRERRSYVYTLVNEMGWESQPSYPSDDITVNTNSEVVLTGLPTQGAEKVRIYRTQNVLDFGTEQQEVVEAAYLLVDEINIGQPTYIDNVQYLGRECMTMEYSPAPDDLRQVQSWRDGYLAGLSGNLFMMSERSQPHAWNYKNNVTFYDNAKALICTNKIAYVLTDGRPVLISINDDCEENKPPLSVTEIGEVLPIVSTRSAAEFVGGVVYASQNGLVFINGNTASIITQNHYTPEQWQKLHPHTMRGAVHNGYYYGTTDKVTIRFRLPDTVYARDNKTLLTTLSIKPNSWFRSNDNNLYYSTDDGVYWWDQGEDLMDMHWRGNLNTLPSIIHFGAYKVIANDHGNIIKHFTDKREIQSYEHHHNNPVRLPVGQRGLDWQVDIKGKAEVFEYHIAPSIRELSNK